jgi:glycosyltransferase involved in cell wall biosynthesis
VSAARFVRAPLRRLRGGAVRLRTRDWPPYSRLFVLGDDASWALDDEAAYVTAVALHAGYRLGPPAWASGTRRQVVFHTSHFAALDPRWTGSAHRLGLSYFHGRPGTQGYPEFDRAYAALRRDPLRFARVHVTHGELEELVRSAGVPGERVHRIPIGIELDAFPLVDPERRNAARRALGLPNDAFVVGSFVKDGEGFGDGLVPKSIKGPDVLVDALASLASQAPELVVLLTGPARGFVRQGLAHRGVRFTHRILDGRAGLAQAYHALDACVIASRQEGGPKSILESMATGAPLVTTRAGQAPDLVRDGENGLLVDVEDADGLAEALVRVRDDGALVVRVRAAGRRTAEETSHRALAPRWEALLEGFAERSDG